MNGVLDRLAEFIHPGDDTVILDASAGMVLGVVDHLKILRERSNRHYPR